MVNSDVTNLNTDQYRFYPSNEQAAEQVAKGNLGFITEANVTVVDGKIHFNSVFGTFIVNAPKLPGPNGDASKNVTSTNSALQQYDMNAFVDAFSLMLLLQKMSNEQRAAAREGRLGAQDAQVALLKKAAEDIRQAAAWAMAAGIVSGAMGILGGICSVAGGVKAAQVQMKGTTNLPGSNAISKMTDPTAQQNAMANLSARVQAINGVSMGLGQGLGGLGQMVSAPLQYVSSMEQAEQKEHEADATKAQNLAEAETEFINHLKEVIRDVQEKIQSMQQANDDTAKQILRA